MTERWASLDGWVPDRDRPGFLKDPTRPGWARDLEGRWYSQLDIDNAKKAVEEAGRQVELDLEIDVEKLRQAAREVLGDG